MPSRIAVSSSFSSESLVVSLGEVAFFQHNSPCLQCTSTSRKQEGTGQRGVATDCKVGMLWVRLNSNKGRPRLMQIEACKHGYTFTPLGRYLGSSAALTRVMAPPDLSPHHPCHRLVGVVHLLRCHMNSPSPTHHFFHRPITSTKLNA
jgi:hypothetical protein